MKAIPKKIFIVPYRNRPEQKFFFCKYMKFLLEYTKEYEVYFSHQCDTRSFNRGATRNIGFLAMKDKYPEHYQDMTFIFNDLDTIPFNRIFDYETEHGVVKHYYGFAHSLGGVVVMKGKDFEDVNGYPNFWSWGLEDSCLQKRCEAHGLKIDRSDFYKIGSPEILQLFDGVERIINKKDPHKLKTDDGSHGLSTLCEIDCTIDKKSTSEMDNVYDSLGAEFQYINIHDFGSETEFEDDEYFKYDLREPTTKITSPDNSRRTNNVNVKPKDWTNIAYYPTSEERITQPTIDTRPPVAPPISEPLVLPKRTRPVRSGLQAIQHGYTPPPPRRPVTRHATSTFEAPTRVNNPTTFKQMRKENVSIFPPKTMNSAGGAAALNKINLRYRMTKV